LYPEVHEISEIFWIPFAPYTWSVNTQSYINTIDDIILCAIGNGITASQYTELAYVKKHWIPFQDDMQAIFDELDVGFNPAFTIFLGLFALVPVFGPLFTMLMYLITFAEPWMGTPK